MSFPEEPASDATLSWADPLMAEPTVSELRRASAAHLDAGQTRQAIDLLTDALVQDPHDVETRRLLGAAHYQAGDYSMAAEILSSAVRVAPNDPSLHCQLGRALEQMGDAEAAESAYREALRLDPRHDDARQALSGVCPELKLSDLAALDPSILCECPGCGERVRRDQARRLCGVCGLNLAPIFSGVVLAERNTALEQVFRCSHCRQPLVQMAGACADCGLNFDTGILPAPSCETLPPAPLVRRVLAAVLDRLAVAPAAYFIAGSIIRSLDPLVYPPSVLPALRTRWLIILPSILAASVEMVTAGEWGASPGKRLMKLGMENRDGTDISVLAAFLRAAPKWWLCAAQALLLSRLLPVQLGWLAWWLPSVSELFAFTNSRRLGLHDLAAGTMVVDGSDLTEPEDGVAVK